MRVAFENLVFDPRYGNSGSAVYANFIAQAIMRRHDDVEFFGFHDSASAPPAFPFPTRAAIGMRSRAFWRTFGANLAAAQNDADVLFSPTAYIVPMGSVPVVATIHDCMPRRLGPEYVPSSWSSDFMSARAAGRSKLLLTDSHWSKKDIVEIYRVPEEKVHVVYLAHDAGQYNQQPVSPEAALSLHQALGMQGDYLLHHGMVQRRKNLVRLLEAYQLLLDRRPAFSMPLVLAGPRGFGWEEIEAKAAQVRRGQVIFTGTLPDDVLAAAVKKAYLSIIPTLYEGFCLPMLESMACGVPTICSTSSCVPEISGHVLEYFAPDSVEQMAQQMERAIFDQALRRNLAERGLARAAEFSWDRCADQTLEVLRLAAGGA